MGNIKQTICSIIVDARISSHVPKMSVIIPIYNVEKYLRECLDSVVNQTLRDIEIICIDDGSTDNSLVIAKEYCDDKRVVILSQANKGLSAARNLGMQYAHGEYVHFLDSDDYMLTKAYEQLYAQASKEKLDMLCFSTCAFCEDYSLTKHAENDNPPYKYSSDIPVVGGDMLFSAFQNARVSFASVCSTLYNRNYLLEHDMFFIEGIIHEDEPFTFEVMLSAERAAYCAEAYYIRRVHEGSIMTMPKTTNNLRGYLVGYFKMCSFLLEHPVSGEAEAAVVAKLEEIRNAISYLTGLIPDYSSELSKCELAIIETVTAQPGALRDRDELKKIKNSKSYRLAQLIALPLRKARGFVRCLREHGVKYTCRRVLIHLHLYREKEPVIKDYNYYQNLPPR